MFNKLLFDRNAFNRSVSSNDMVLAFHSTSALTPKVVIRVPLTLRTMSGSSSLSLNNAVQYNVGLNMQGSGVMNDIPTTLRMRMTSVNLTSSGSFAPRPNVHTPIRGAISSTSNLSVSNRLYFLQHLQSILSGNGSLQTNTLLHTSLLPFQFTGTSTLKGMIAVQLPIGLNAKGTSGFELRRLGALNENILQLENINLMPGESVVIDTDTLQVLFGTREDVSSITNDSIFFELNPGENEISIATDTGEELDVVIIWQNRWL